MTACERAVSGRPERHALPRHRAMPEAEHLLAGEGHPDGPLQLAGGQDRQEYLVLGAQSRAEGPADERARRRGARPA